MEVASRPFGLFVAASCLLAVLWTVFLAEGQTRPSGGSARFGDRTPYPMSSVIKRLEVDFSTHRRLAPGSDNWPVTWADDGHLYAAWGDGGGFGGTNSNGRVSLGIARIEGEAVRYLLCTEDSETHAGRLGMFDAPEPWGPWTTVAYEVTLKLDGQSPEALSVQNGVVVFRLPDAAPNSFGTTPSSAPVPHLWHAEVVTR